MREIKFRVWDGEQMLSLSQGVSRELIVIQENSFKGYEMEINFDEVVLMQYTGLKDKNGKEIYEGDILQLTDMEYLDMPDFKGIVAINDCEFFLKDKNNESIELWSDGSNDYFTMSLIQTTECCEIIGDIYSNPELIK